MSWIIWDEDEWEIVTMSESYGSFMGVPQGSCGISYRRRPSEDVKAIKTEKRRKHEAEVLAEADAIRANRAA